MVWWPTVSRTPKVVILMVLGGILVSFLLIPIAVLLGGPIEVGPIGPIGS